MEMGMQMERSLFNSIEENGIANESRTVAEEARRHAQQPVHQNAQEGLCKKPKASDLRKRLTEIDYRCQLSGVKLSPDVLSVDHEVPIEAGGRHTLDNVLLVHAVVNIMKGTQSKREFIGWCRLVASHNFDDDTEEHF